MVKRSLFHPTVHTVRRLFSGTRLRLSAGPSADSNHCVCSWPHANPASQPRQFLLLQHSPRTWRLSLPCSLQISCFPLVLNSTHQSSHCCSHWSLVLVPQRLHLAMCSPGIIAGLLMQFAITSLSKTFVPRSLGFSFVPQRTTLNCPSRNACWCHR